MSLLFFSPVLTACIISANEFEVYNMCSKVHFLKNMGISCDVETVASVIKISWYFWLFYCSVIHYVALISKFHITELRDFTF
jgi:hypothetical protein